MRPDWDALHAAARESLAVFTQLAWPELNRGVQLVWGRHNEAICEHLEAVTRGQIRKLIINIPPGTSKTTHVCQTWPVWEWLRHPHHRWGFATYEQGLSTRDSVKRRDLIRSDWYQDAFSPSWGLKADEKLKTIFGNDAGGEMRAMSVGGAATGYHFDRLVTDDPLRAMDVYTVRLQNHITWYEEQWASRLRDPDRSVQLIIMQRLHDRDLAGVKSMDPSWTVLRLPMLYEKSHHCFTRIGWEDWRREEGEPLCPERFGQEFIDEKKRKANVWSAQYQQRPKVGDGTIFKASWMRFYYLDEPIDGAVPYPGDVEMDRWVGSWDMTFDGGAKSDYVVGQVWARKGATCYLRDQVRDQMRFTEQRMAAVRLAKKWPEVTRWLIEAAANGHAVIDSLRSPSPTESGRGEFIAGIVPVKPSGPKTARAEAVADYFQGGNVVLPHPSIAPWVQDYIDELTAFPTGGNDDQVDATSQGLRDIFRTSALTAADMDAVLGQKGRVPSAADFYDDRASGSDRITDPRRAEHEISEMRREAEREALATQRERERIAARLGLDVPHFGRFSTRDFGR